MENCIKNGMIEFDFKTRTAGLPDGGILPFSAATLGMLGGGGACCGVGRLGVSLFILRMGS